MDNYNFSLSLIVVFRFVGPKNVIIPNFLFRRPSPVITCSIENSSMRLGSVRAGKEMTDTFSLGIERERDQDGS